MSSAGEIATISASIALIGLMVVLWRIERGQQTKSREKKSNEQQQSEQRTPHR